ncbi:hypothetical protein HDA40_002401 [Hamadaea flava]|uniref:PPE family protein n=1 Tax=Hamadaea flava TaxID=1742688 RepID=A0ABV8LL23_9ACTN|nr:hypothetical protein [Hamadaea flava]MCP2323894.1 hypothetical protein [Hamadaea flava]
MGDGDLLQAELEGLRAFSGDARRAALGFAGVAGEELPDIEAAARNIGNPPGFLELARFGRVALADLKVLKSFSLDFGDGLSSTGYAADLAAGWYERVEQQGKKTLQKIEDALVAGEAPGPDYGETVTAPAAPPAAPKDYGYARPGDTRTGWDALSLDQIKALILGVDVTAVTDVAAGWRRIADAIDTAQRRFGEDVKGLHWYGEGGTEFHGNVGKTVASAKRWRASADQRASNYEMTAVRLANAKSKIQQIAGDLKTTLDDRQLDLAEATTPEKQDVILKQINQAWMGATISARAIAKQLGEDLATSGDAWEPVDRYRGLVGLDPNPPTGGLDAPGGGNLNTPNVPNVPGGPDVPGGPNVPTPPGPPNPGPGPDDGDGTNPGDGTGPTGNNGNGSGQVVPPNIPGIPGGGVNGAAGGVTPPGLGGSPVTAPVLGPPAGLPVLSGRPPLTTLPPGIGGGSTGVGGLPILGSRGGLTPSLGGRGTSRGGPPITRLPGAPTEQVRQFEPGQSRPDQLHRLDDGDALPLMPGLAGRSGLTGPPLIGGPNTQLRPAPIVDRSGLVTGRGTRTPITAHGDEDLPPGMPLGLWPSPGVRLDGRWAASPRAFAGQVVQAAETRLGPDVLRSRTVHRGAPRWTEPVPAEPVEPGSAPSGGTARAASSSRGSSDRRRRAGPAGEQHG